MTKAKCVYYHIQEDVYYETCKNIKYTDIKQYNEKRRMWRMPDLLPVSLQDLLHSWKSDL